MRIIAVGNNFGLRHDNTEPELRAAIIAKEKCGFKFVDGFMQGDLAALELLKNHKPMMRCSLTMSQDALALYNAAGKSLLTAVEQSHAKTSDAIISVPAGLEYLPFQCAGIAYATQRTHALIADEMGLGKTVQAIGVANTLEARRVLVVSPASLKHNWRREFKKWSVNNNLLVEIIEGEEEYDFKGDVIIINYDILQGHRSELKKRPWDLVILDECHYLKNGRTDRTLEVFGGIKRNPDKTIKERFDPIPAKRMLLLSGTPLVNKPKELWPLVRAIDPEGLGADWYRFATRYCQAVPIERWSTQTNRMERIGWKWDGADNLDELQEIMRSRFMVRRLKKDVLTELPPKCRQVIVLDPKPQLAKLVAKEVLTYAQHSANIEDYETVLPSIGEMSELRKKIAIKKVPYAVEHIKEVLNETEKVVVFAHHHEVLDALSKAFEKESVRIDGRVALSDRQTAVDRFQSDPSCRVFIGGIQAAGVGITLTAASVVVFVELDWVPGNVSQAEDRLHRIGQKESVLVQHIVLEGSLDERVVEVIVRKQNIIDKALDKP